MPGEGPISGYHSLRWVDKPLSPKGFGIDLAYQAILYEARTIAGNVNPTVNGTYRSTLHVGSLNLRVNF